MQLYGKVDNSEIVWSGDLSHETKLSSFRLLTVIDAQQLTPHMRRIRFSGQELDRFESMRGMHIRMFFPTAEIPNPVWPIAGPDGLPFWSDVQKKPVPRVYTIRKLDVASGWVDVDFVLHEDEHGNLPGVGAAWAAGAMPGDEVGVIGPLGRPLRDADWYVMGCDETGIPALSRILENLPAHTSGVAFIEVDGRDERQTIPHPDGVLVHWLHREDGAQRLADAVLSIEWPADKTTFGWFAAEGEAAAVVRSHWRTTLGYGRDQTLAAAYWKKGVSGVMAG